MTQSTEVRNESFQKMSEKIGKRQAEVLALLTAEPMGLTAWEIAAKLSRPVYVVRPRITELFSMTKIYAEGTRFHSPTGRRETVWHLVGKGQLEMFQ
jgi:predicted ArsR family transcriptional regulator